ncbi:MAG TPA: hypothetical protein VL981_13130, partial [Candidatus Methylacidiphilales bacterium]|nr:hypothetical protein [Candidatus Methylacidiphilales bacterium]
MEYTEPYCWSFGNYQNSAHVLRISNMKRFLVQTIFFGLLSLSSLQAQLFAVGVSANGYGTYSVNPSTGAATLLSNFANPPGGLYASSLISDPSLGVAYETAGNNSEYTFSLSTGAVLSTAPLALPFTGSTGLVTNAGGGLLFAVGESSSGWGDYSVNPSTGAATLLNTFVNPPGGFYVASLISNPLLGVAYELSGNNTEYTFSLSTGAILSTAPLALPFNGSSGFLTNAGGGLLFAVGESGGEWGDYSVNPSTGAATLLNNFTGCFYVSSLIS